MSNLLQCSSYADTLGTLEENYFYETCRILILPLWVSTFTYMTYFAGKALHDYFLISF